jgi:hypothetical protein
LRRTAPVLLLALLLTSCTGDDEPTATPTVPSPSSTCVFGGPTISVECVDSQAEPSTASFPGDASQIPAVTLPEVTGRLGGAHNRDDPTLRTATFTVTVPAGARIGSDVMCLGNGKVTLDTAPKSDAFQSITCNSDATEPSELIVEDPDVLTEATTFTVTVTADKASRWDVAVFATTAAPGQSQG